MSGLGVREGVGFVLGECVRGRVRVLGLRVRDVFWKGFRVKRLG